MMIRSHRRRFFRQALAGSTLVALGERTVPGFLGLTAQAAATAAKMEGHFGGPARTSPRRLVVIQLLGGNDGLNTVVPFRNDGYLRARRALRITPNQVVRLNDDLGLHPGLSGFSSLWDKQRLAIVQGVGYPNPDRSHFRSMEIWETARMDPNALETGWLGRALEAQAATERQRIATESPIGREPDRVDVPALQLGVGASRLAVLTPQVTVPNLTSLENFRLQLGAYPSAQRDLVRNQLIRNAAPAAEASTSGAANPLLAFARQVTLTSFTTSARLEAVAPARGGESAPRWGLQQRLGQIAQVLKAGFQTSIFYTTLDGFDTHANQLGSHAALMQELGDSLAAFDATLHEAGLDKDVAVLVFSEFGRRVSENASQGTDHGAAAPVFVAGAVRQAGLIGDHPALEPNQLDDGDLKHHTDFRRIYAALLQDWLQIDPVPILGPEFRPLPLFASLGVASPPE